MRPTTFRTSATLVTTTTAPTTASVDYEEDVEEISPIRGNEGPIPPLPPANLRTTKGSPAQQARLLFQEHVMNDEEEDRNEREVELVQKKTKEKTKTNNKSSVKGTSLSPPTKGGRSSKRKPNEISKEKLQQLRITPKPTSGAKVLMTTGPTTTSDEELEAVFVRSKGPSKLLSGTIHYTDRPTTTPLPTTTTSRPTTTSTPSPTTTSPDMTTTLPPNVVQQQIQKENQPNALLNQISIHQLISEAMPTLQMSVVPVYFVNRVTKAVMAVPYLIMKSISKMPLIPGMFDGLSKMSNPSVPSNLMHFQNQRLQRITPTLNGLNLLTLRPSVRERNPVQSVEDSDDVSFEMPRKSDVTELDIEQEKAAESESEDETDSKSDQFSSASKVREWVVLPPSNSK